VGDYDPYWDIVSLLDADLTRRVQRLADLGGVSEAAAQARLDEYAASLAARL
jgi:hypothetical protein